MVIMPCNIKLPFHSFFWAHTFAKFVTFFKTCIESFFFTLNCLQQYFFAFCFITEEVPTWVNLYSCCVVEKFFFPIDIFLISALLEKKGFSCHFSFFSNWQTWWKTIEGEMTEWENMDFPFIWYFFIWRDKLIFICLSLVCAFKKKEKLEMMEC